MTTKREKTRRHCTQCCGSWALVFMGTCNRLPDLNQDVICNQPPVGGGGVADSITIAMVRGELDPLFHF
jgi:hypothetical protein